MFTESSINSCVSVKEFSGAAVHFGVYNLKACTWFHQHKYLQQGYIFFNLYYLESSHQQQSISKFSILSKDS